MSSPFFFFGCKELPFCIQNRSKPSTSEDETSPLLGSDVRLGTEGSCGPLFDIASSPLADFHHCEKLQQEISHKVGSFLAYIVSIVCSVHYSLYLVVEF